MKEYIEREAILQYAEKMYALAQKHVREGNTESDVWKATHETQMNERKEFVDLLQSAPAADVAEVRHGRWMDAESDDGCTVWHCSACSCPVKTIGGYPIYRHCPMCGALMDKGADHEVS